MIILTNDDGGMSPTLEKTIRALGGFETLIAVPSKDVSGCSMCITIDKEILVEKKKIFGRDVFVCGGKTADCVLLGKTIAKKPIQGLISGINTGPNLGLDIIYSGTVAGARKGCLLGIPSVAISMERGAEKDQKVFYESAYSLLGVIADLLLVNPPPKNHFVNVNIPNQPLENIGGAIATVAGRRGYEDRMSQRKKRGKTLVFICEDERIVEDFTPGTDSWAISKNFVSLTLLKDMINESVTDWGLDSWAESINSFLEVKK